MSSDAKPTGTSGESTNIKRASTQPRWIQAGRAGAYLSMNRNRFNAEVCPHLTEIPIGQRGIAFDRLELDAWADRYMARNGRSAPKKEERVCLVDESQGSRKRHSPMDASSGRSTRESKATAAFARALELAKSRTRKPSSSSGSRKMQGRSRARHPTPATLPRSRGRVPDEAC